MIKRNRRSLGKCNGRRSWGAAALVLAWDPVARMEPEAQLSCLIDLTLLTSSYTSFVFSDTQRWLRTSPFRFGTERTEVFLKATSSRLTDYATTLILARVTRAKATQCRWMLRRKLDSQHYQRRVQKEVPKTRPHPLPSPGADARWFGCTFCE